MNGKSSKNPRDWKRPLGFIAGGLVLGVALMQFLIAFDHYTSTDEFCTTCHSMSYPFEEYSQSIHRNSRSGVRAQCGDCHVSEGVFAATWDHFMGYQDLMAQLFGPKYDDPVVFELHRPEMAFKARRWFKERNSATCRRCHVQEAIVGSRPRVAEIHMEDAKGKSCIECHYNLVHRKVPDEKVFKRDKWNEMIEKEFDLAPGTAARMLADH
jgi:nitrate/TMAO reductase-like tetraheme cytochrome c subunit